MTSTTTLSAPSTATEFFPQLVSVFASATANTPHRQCSLQTILHEIASDAYADAVGRVRALLQAGDKDAAAAVKKRLPAFLVSASCRTRAASVPLSERGIVHTGFLQIDLDRKDNPALADIASVRGRLQDDPHIAAVFVSPGGVGLKAIARILPDLDEHAASFAAVHRHLLNVHGLRMDAATKDPLRLCFVSDDPDIEINPHATPLAPLPHTPQPAPATTTPPARMAHVYHAHQGDVQSADEIREMLRHVAPRPDYSDWLRIASAVWSVLPMEEGCRLLAEWSPEEKTGEYASKWRHKLGQVGIGTLVHYAQMGGFDASAAAKRRHNAAGRVRFTDRPTVSQPARPQPLPQPDSAPAPVPAPESRPLPPPMPEIKWPRQQPADGNRLYALSDTLDLPSLAGLQSAIDAGVLCFVEARDRTNDGSDNWPECDAWLVTDRAKRAMLMRRLDGRPWECNGRMDRPDKKADAGWPIGIAAIDARPSIAAVETSADLIAFHHLLAVSPTKRTDIGAVIMPADGLSKEAAPFFAGRDMVIYHYDIGTIDKWQRWGLAAGCRSVSVFDIKTRQIPRLLRSPVSFHELVVESRRGEVIAPRNPPPTAQPAPVAAPAGGIAPGYCPQCAKSNIVAVTGGMTCPHPAPQKQQPASAPTFSTT